MRLTTAPPGHTHPLFSQAILTALAGLLFAPALQAQPVAPQPQAAVTASAPAPVAAEKPKYSRADRDLAFGFMDSNKDGKLSREEAANFRNVAKHFDAADTNKDQNLSREEFENALTARKSR